VGKTGQIRTATHVLSVRFAAGGQEHDQPPAALISGSICADFDGCTRRVQPASEMPGGTRNRWSRGYGTRTKRSWRLGLIWSFQWFGRAVVLLLNGTFRSDPVDGLSSNGGDVIEVGVVVQDRCAVMFRRRGGEEIHDSGCAVLAPCGHQRLHLAGTHRDLVDGRELDQVATSAENPLVLGGITCRVAQFKIYRNKGGEHSICRQRPEADLRRRGATSDGVGGRVSEEQRAQRRAPPITSASVRSEPPRKNGSSSAARDRALRSAT